MLRYLSEKGTLVDGTSKNIRGIPKSIIEDDRGLVKNVKGISPTVVKTFWSELED